MGGTELVNLFADSNWNKFLIADEKCIQFQNVARKKFQHMFPRVLEIKDEHLINF